MGATFSAHIPLRYTPPEDEAGDTETVVAFTPGYTRPPASAEHDKGPMFGAEDYCVKPVERKWFLDKLQALARRAPLEKVLIIDDEEAARYILKVYLAGTCYAVIEAADGEQGLRLAETEKPGVVFLDLMMPGMNGFEVLQRLRANPETRNIPVIIITSKVLDQIERRALSRDDAIQAGWDALPKAVESDNQNERHRHDH
jgi:CheY-like chemotaxis protein